MYLNKTKIKKKEEEEKSRFTLDATFEFYCIISLTNIIK